MAFVDAHKDRDTDGLRWGVEPICRVLQVAPATYYAARSRPASRRSVRDGELKSIIARSWRQNFSVYGSEKIWRQLRRDGIACGRDRVARLMAEMGICGARRGKPRRTTVPAPGSERPEDLVRRVFAASGPNRLWVADLTYVSTRAGFAYVAFIIDAYSKAIVGWKVDTSLHAELALDALDMPPSPGAATWPAWCTTTP